MSEIQINTCEKAIKVLRATAPSHSHYRARVEAANQIELQLLVGDPRYDDLALALSSAILRAAGQ